MPEPAAKGLDRVLPDEAKRSHGRQCGISVARFATSRGPLRIVRCDPWRSSAAFPPARSSPKRLPVDLERNGGLGFGRCAPRQTLSSARHFAITTGVSQDAGAALASAEAQVAAVRDDPAARLALMARLYHGPTGRAPRHLPFRRAALSFMRWQAQRGVLNPLDASPPGSVWWRAVNERLLRDGCEAVALLGGLAGEPSSQAVRLWLEFSATRRGATGTERTTRASWAATWSTGTSPRRRARRSASS